MTSHGATNRVEQGVSRGEPFAFTLDGRTVEAFPGETVAAALLALDVRTLRRTEKIGSPRGASAAWEFASIA